MATKFTKEELIKLPKYVTFGVSGCHMRLHNPEWNQFPGWREDIAEYWRDAGLWGVDIRIEEDKIFSVHKDMDWLDNVELIPSTYEEWFKSNQGYISKSTKAVDFSNIPEYDEDNDEIPY